MHECGCAAASSECAQAVGGAVQGSSGVRAGAWARRDRLAERVPRVRERGRGDMCVRSAPAPRPPTPPCGAPRTRRAVSLFFF